MGEARWAEHWRQLYERLDIVSPVLRARPLPTDAHLARLEAHLACRLPASYRAFVKAIGPGYLARHYVVFAPGYRGASVVDFLMNNRWRDAAVASHPDPDRVRRLVAFGYSAPDFYVWDSREVLDENGPEYAVYGFRPLEPNEPVGPVAASFPAFVEDGCLGGGLWRAAGGKWAETWRDDEGEVRSSRCFEPIGDRPRSAI